MVRILVVYGTTDGHTQLVAERMVAAVEATGHTAVAVDAKTARMRSQDEEVDGVIVGGSVHAGELQSALKDWTRGNRALLERVPTTFFVVCLAAADMDEEAQAEIQATVEKFARETGWRPPRVEPIGGALVYTHYNFFIRHLMRMIVKRHGGTQLDTSRDYDLTDWARVEEFAREFAGSLAVAGAPAA